MSDAEAILNGFGAGRVLADLHGQPSQPQAWDPPVPLNSRPALPAFPADALPGWVADQVTAVAEETQTPTDLAGCIALAVLATATGGRAIVHVHGNWTEPVNLFTVVAMPPASRKSPVFRAMTAPLLDAEKRLKERTEPHIVEAELARKIAANRAEKATKTAVNHTDSTTNPDTMAEATDAALAAEAITVPVPPRLVADDVTPETAASLLAEQGGRLAVLSAEGEIFNVLAGRYSNTPNLGVFLKGHAGDMLRVDRKGRPAEHIDHPALTLGLAVQPEVIRDIATMPGFRGKGLLGRILYALPESNIGYRTIEPNPVPADVTHHYATNVDQLVTSMHGWDDPARIQLTPEAYTLFINQRHHTEKRLRPDNDLSHIGDWAGKYDGAVARIAGLLHLATHTDDGWRHPISADTMRAALRIGEYFTHHALAAFDTMGADPDTDNARTILDWLERTKPATFTAAEVGKALQRTFKGNRTGRESALALLEEYGWIHRQPEPPKNGPGRHPTPTYTVHPHIRGSGAQPPHTTPDPH